MKMKRAIAMIGTLVLLTCSDPYPGFDDVGYFKGETNARIFIVEISGTHDSKEVASYAHSLMHTDGRLTVAFFYSKKVSWAQALTLTHDFDQAYDIVDERWKSGDRWDYFYSKGIGGDETFADCISKPKVALCGPSR